MSFNKVEICNVDTSTLKTLTEDEKQELLRSQKLTAVEQEEYSRAETLMLQARELENEIQARQQQTDSNPEHRPIVEAETMAGIVASMTGIPASGPMSPRPSTAVPSVITATRLPFLVYS